MNDSTQSLWSQTAGPAPDTPALKENRRIDVAVVGAGFTGLSAALHLAQRGTSVAVVDRHGPGWGASGRNGGQVIPGLKLDPDDLIAKLGRDEGDALAQVSGATADLVFSLIAHHGLNCGAHRGGWIQAAHHPKHLDAMQRRCAQWADRGAAVDWLDQARMDELTPRAGYVGGWIDRRGGKLQPLSYARELARAVLAQGGAVYGASPATALDREGGKWRLRTPEGELRADAVILATNGYTDRLWPGLEETVIPVYSVQVATDVLSENLRGGLLPGGEVLSDSRRVLWYFRHDDDGRLVMGGGGGGTEASAARLYSELHRRARRLLPDGAEPDFRFAWSGCVALTGDHLPHLHELAPGLWAGLGYNGRGVAMATMMGKQLADRLGGEEKDAPAFPSTALQAIPLHALRRQAIGPVRRYYALRDWLEARA